MRPGLMQSRCLIICCFLIPVLVKYDIYIICMTDLVETCISKYNGVDNRYIGHLELIKIKIKILLQKT